MTMTINSLNILALRKTLRANCTIFYIFPTMYKMPLTPTTFNFKYALFSAFQVLQLGLEGLVLKDLESTYEPGKRHWLKVKKDYLFDGAMADTADLVVLGAWFGTYYNGHFFRHICFY